MESENNELYRLEQIFNKTLLTIPNVQLWSVYLDYVRRRNNLTTDAAGQARRIISSAYDFALQNIGLDKDAGNIWVDHIDFIRSGPGNIGGSGWQDQQKMDSLRKAYQRAICVPTQAVNTLWKEYDQFEMGLNKLTVLLSSPIPFIKVRPTYIFLFTNLGPQVFTGEISIVYDCAELVYRTSKYHQGTCPNVVAKITSSSRF